MILAIEYLHTKNIIYRDIKPENIMVDESGYLKMVDMGTAKILTKNKRGLAKTFTIIGTPHYMAPEVIAGKGYTYSADLWSIGVCFYEFVCGYVPFGEEKDDPFEIYEEIVMNPITYPKYFSDKTARKLIEQLLNKVPEVRLGSSFASLKQHSYFENFDWDMLLDKKLKPFYVPPKKDIIDLKDIEKIYQQKIKVTEKIKSEEKRVFKKKAPKDPYWDKNF